MPTITTKYNTDAPETRDQAETLLKEYYKTHPNDQLPKRHNLLSWKLNEDGTMVVVDGTSGRKLEFVIDKDRQDKVQAEELAEDAEQAALDAKAEVDNAEAVLARAKAKLKEAETEANKKPFKYIDTAVKEEAKAKEEAEAKARAETKTMPGRYQINMEDGVDEEEGSAAGKALRARQKPGK